MYNLLVYMIKISAFDFDGTIANTIPVSIAILKRFAKNDYKKDLDDSLIQKLRDKPIPEIFKELNVPIVKLPFIARRTRKALNKEIEFLKPIKGIKVMLAELKKQGQILGIVSSNSSESIQKFLVLNGLDIFDFIYTKAHVFGKAGSLKKIIKEYDCTPWEVVYFGDEIRDIEAARKVGIKIVSVTWGVNSKDKLISYAPDFLVDSPSEILELFKRKFL